MQRSGNDVVRGIEHVNSAVPKLRQAFRFEYNVPAIDCPGWTKSLPHRLHVKADAGSAPHVVYGVLIAGVIDGQPFGNIRPDIAQILEFAFVQLLKNAGLHLSLKEISGGHDDIVARLSRKQLCLKRLIGIESVVLNLDPGFPGEVFNDLGIYVVGPIVDVYDTRALRNGLCCQKARCENNHAPSGEPGAKILMHDSPKPNRRGSEAPPPSRL